MPNSDTKWKGTRTVISCYLKFHGKLGRSSRKIAGKSAKFAVKFYVAKYHSTCSLPLCDKVSVMVEHYFSGKTTINFCLRFCWTRTKWYLITSQTRVKRVSRTHHWTILRWCIRLTRLTLVCEVIRYCLVQVRQNFKKKKDFGLAARNRLSLPLPLSFSSSSYFLSFSIQK